MIDDPRECPAEELSFASGEVDLLSAMTAAHWFNHQKFLLEADRVLRPGGCLALLSYTMDFELEYGDISDKLNDICKEVHPKNKNSILGIYLQFLKYRCLCTRFSTFNIILGG